MEIKRKTETITISKEKTVYVAFDGKEFEYMGDCSDYEEKELLKQLKKSKNLKYYPGAENCEFPFYNDFIEQVEFYYFKILNEEGLKEIINYYCTVYPEYYNNEHFKDDKIGDIICIHFDDHADGPLYANMRYIKKDTEIFFDMFDWK